MLAARTPGEALRLARKHGEGIELLITDVVMPEMNGRGLARQVLAIHPGIRCLYMSGYTADVIAHHGVLEAGVAFIQKPFTAEEMEAKVRALPDAPSSTQGRLQAPGQSRRRPLQRPGGKIPPGQTEGVRRRPLPGMRAVHDGEEWNLFEM